MHTYMVTQCDIYCEVFNLHVNVCNVLTLFKRVNSNILLCLIKFYTCAYSNQLFNILFYVIISSVVNYLEIIFLSLMIKLPILFS